MKVFDEFDELLDAKPAVPSHTKRTRQTIMIVDDSLEIINALTEVLEMEYDVISAYSCKDALDKLTDGIQLVILDIKMAGADGLSTYHQLKKRHESLRIIINSAYPGGSKKNRELAELPHDGYLTKGNYSISAILDLVRKILENVNS